jgi:hypothetical protein
MKKNGLAAANVNRSYSLAATSIAIFTFVLLFLYPKFRSAEIDGILFQATLLVMGVATFSFVLASFFYYCSSIGTPIADLDPVSHFRRGDRYWLLGFSLLYLVPTLILLSVGLLVAGFAWLAFWLVHLLYIVRCYPGIRTAQGSATEAACT